MAINWADTTYGTRPEGPNIRYDENGNAIKNIGGVEAGMAMRWNPKFDRQNTPVGIGSNINPGGVPGAGTTPPPVWEGQENDRPFYDTGTANTSWDFDPFRPSSPQGGESPDDGMSPWGEGENPFSTPIQLGRDSPWGDPNISGGNQDMYRQQLSRLNTQQNAHQGQALANAMRREAKKNAPKEAFNADWSWTDLPEVKVAGQPDWQLNRGIGPNATNRDIIDRFRPYLTGDAQDFFDQMRGEMSPDQKGWAQAGSPDTLINNSRLGPGGTPYFTELANALYSNKTAPLGPGSTPAGYAAVRS